MSDVFENFILIDDNPSTMKEPKMVTLKQSMKELGYTEPVYAIKDVSEDELPIIGYQNYYKENHIAVEDAKKLSLAVPDVDVTLAYSAWQGDDQEYHYITYRNGEIKKN